MDDLLQLIKEKSFRRGQFTLASGLSSDYFFDLKPTMLHPLGAVLIAERIWEIVRELGADAIGGLAVGAVPIVATTVARSFRDNGIAIPLPGFYVRKEIKDHGTQQRIEGLDVRGLNVVLVEDVTTSGGSLWQAAKTVRANGGRVENAITVVDRLAGGAELLGLHGIELESLFTLHDFADDMLHTTEAR